MEGAADKPPARSELPRGTEMVLLVEDEDAVRAVLKDILESCGYRVSRIFCALFSFAWSRIRCLSLLRPAASLMRLRAPG